MSKLLEDRDGSTSSKRVAGYVIAGAGLALLLTIGVLSVWKKILDPGTALEVGKILLITGSSLLGVGVLEHIGGKK